MLVAYVDHHDDAYAWAERRRIEAHPRTGAIQIVEVRERVEDVAPPDTFDFVAPEAMVAASVPLPDGLRVLSPEDMICHAAAHLFADGDLAGGLRNLWDIDRLLRQFSAADGFWRRLHERASLHQLLAPVHRAGRLANDLYGTPLPEGWRVWDRADPLYRARLLARDGWGRTTRPALRFGFYVRSHWLRMPPAMLARHLLKKARR